MSTLNVWIFFAIVTSLSLTAEVRSTTTSTEPEGSLAFQRAKSAKVGLDHDILLAQPKLTLKGGRKQARNKKERVKPVVTKTYQPVWLAAGKVWQNVFCERVTESFFAVSYILRGEREVFTLEEGVNRSTQWGVPWAQKTPHSSGSFREKNWRFPSTNYCNLSLPFSSPQKKKNSPEKFIFCQKKLSQVDFYFLWRQKLRVTFSWSHQDMCGWGEKKLAQIFETSSDVATHFYSWQTRAD